MSKKKRTYVEIEDLEDPIPAGGRIMQCPSCGAPVTSEICDECGVETGMHPVTGNMEYQQMECKSVVMNDTTILMPSIFAVLFGIVAVVTTSALPNLEGLESWTGEDTKMLLAGLACAIISMAGLVILIRNLAQYIQVKFKGEYVQAKVCGYINDTMRENKRYAQIVKLLAVTPDGRKYIFYRLYKAKRPYPVGSNLWILIYKDLVLIPKNQKDHR